jgi:hypothetical protein
MSDDFEDLLKRWLRERAGDDRAALRALAGNVATLPRRRQPNRLLPLVASVAVIVGILVFAAPRLGQTGGQAVVAPPSTTPVPTLGGPAGFAGDPRLARCFGGAGHVEFVFEMTHARDYQRYFPHMLLAPELDVDDPAFVVVFDADFPGVETVGGVGAVRKTLQPGHRYVCAIVRNGDPTLYADVDITGLTVNVAPSSAGPSASDVPTQSPASGATPTPTPAPAWMAGAEAALGCDGPPADFKPNWTRGELHTTARGTPELAIAELAHRVNSYGVPFPNAGWEEIGRVDGTRAFGYANRGADRAIVIVAAEGTGASARWWIDDVAVCQAAELGPDAEIGVQTGRWTDAAGSPVDAAVVETPDCYFGTMLRMDGRLFVWSPADNAADSYGTGHLEAPIGVIEAAPDDSLDTGYRSAERSLFLAPDGRAAFVILPDGVQRWAHVTGDDFQRTDCN